MQHFYAFSRNSAPVNIYSNANQYGLPGRRAGFAGVIFLCALLLCKVCTAQTNMVMPVAGGAAVNKGFATKNPSSMLKNEAAFGGGKHLAFVENKGQVTDHKKQPRMDIQYALPATAGLNIFVGSGAIHYQFNKNNRNSFWEK